MTRTLTLALALCAPACPAAAADTPAATLRGAWLFDSAALKQRSELGRVWESVVTIEGDAFALSKLMGARADLKGTLAFDPKDPTAVDLRVAELDLSELLPDYKVPAGVLAARYKLEGDRLTLCFPRQFTGKRPTEFAANADQFLATLVRAPKGYAGPPKEIKVSAFGPDGKPAAGALVCQHMYRRDEPGKKKGEWEYVDARACGADGTVTLPFEKVTPGPFIATTAARDAIGLTAVSPARLAGGALRVELRPQVRVTGTLTCDELTKAGQPLGWAGGYLMLDGSPAAYYGTKDGRFEFLAPPGKYTLQMYGGEVGTRFIEITVPEDRSEYDAGAVALPALAFAVLKGKPAPELVEVKGWKGDPVRLADLKGKVVLLEFWGYWCGPCIGSMPVLIELHERFADKGLAIVGVHMDIDGEVDTPAKLDAKLVAAKREHWKGKDVPFPNALVSGTRVGTGDDAGPGGTVAKYGVRGYPTTILIDREGRVVGQFHARDIKAAAAEIEKLLAPKK